MRLLIYFPALGSLFCVTPAVELFTSILKRQYVNLPMQDARIHYKCSFKIIINDIDTSWTNVVVTIRDWVIGVINKYEGDSKPLRFTNLHSGGSWSLSTTKHLKVNAYREQGASSEADPEFWTIGLEHSDSTNTFRIWRTDVGLRKLGTRQY